MEELEKKQRTAKNMTTVFTVALFLLPLLMFGYKTALPSFAGVWAFFIEVSFTVMFFFGILSVYLTILNQMAIEKDMISKIKKSYPNFELTRKYYNFYLVEEKQADGSLVSKGYIELNMDTPPTSRVEIHFEAKTAFYK